MKFSDIVALAKAGFTPADIRDFLKESAPEEKTPDDKQPETEKQTAEEAQEPKQEEADKSEKETAEKPPAADASVDYKKQYEQAMEALKLAQAANTRQEMNSAPPESDEDVFTKAALNFM